MLRIERPADMDAYVGQMLGTGEWLTVTQGMIDGFAEATGDHQWIHVDPERARAELPGGQTIAHGYLTLALVPRLGESVFTIVQKSRSVNYGSNRVRFTHPVPSGSRLRARQTLKHCEPVEGGRRLVLETTIEIDGQERPALVAETISVAYDL